MLTFALDLGTARMAAHLQQPHAARPATPTSTSVIKGAFLLANSLSGKAMNARTEQTRGKEGKERDRMEREEKGRGGKETPQPGMETNALGNDGKSQDEAEPQQDTWPCKQSVP